MIGRLVWNQGGQVGRGEPLWERGRPGALVKQALGGVVESAESEPKTHHCVDRRVVRMGSPLPQAATQIQEAFQLPRSEQEVGSWARAGPERSLKLTCSGEGLHEQRAAAAAGASGAGTTGGAAEREARKGPSG